MKIAPTPPQSTLLRTDFPFSPAKFPVFDGWAILVALCLQAIASAIGPSLLANFKAITGSYSGGLYACCLFAPVVIVLMLFVRLPAEIDTKAQS